MLDGTFRLIPMQESDLDEVLDLEQRSFSEPWTRKMFLGELQGNAFATNLVLRAGDAGFGEGVGAGALLGYIMFWVVFEELHLMNLAVRPEARRHGIGLALVRHALRRRKAYGRRCSRCGRRTRPPSRSTGSSGLPRRASAKAITFTHAKMQ